MACGCAEYRRSRKKSIFDDFKNFEKISKNRFFEHFGALWGLGGVGKLGFFGFLMIWTFLDFFDFFGFWGVVWKFWREAMGLSWEFSVGCKDSSGLVGFDYDGLHGFTYLFLFFSWLVCCSILRMHSILRSPGSSPRAYVAYAFYTP